MYINSCTVVVRSKAVRMHLLFSLHRLVPNPKETKTKFGCQISEIRNARTNRRHMKYEWAC